MRKILVSLFTLLLLLACKVTQKESKISSSNQPAGILCGPTPANLNTEPGNSGALVPLFEGLDVYSYPVTTSSERAQRYFNQGFILNYGFNHAEAARSFQEAIRIDPDCAMCYWGLAYVLGPNYNAPMFPEVHTAALEAVQNAKLKMHLATPKEKALIMAIDKRYAASLDIDPMPYYEAYAGAMKSVLADYPEDVDIAAMTAESLMNLHPWNIWTKKGEPQPWTEEILTIIRSGLHLDPDHPQLNHLYIHAMEASNKPEIAMQAADTLGGLVPGSGHLVHMPSHLYINTGDYHKGKLANARAVKIDSAYVEACHADGIYPLAYYPHNWHFLAACAALEGDGATALNASRYMSVYTVDKNLMRDSSLLALQHFYSIPWFIQVKFAMWEDILNEPKPDEDLRYPLAIWHYAQGMAKAAMGQPSFSEVHLDELKNIAQEPGLQEVTIWDINKMTQVLDIARYVLEGEIARRKGDFTAAVSAFTKAVELEDMLNYNEPPDWFFSVRHHLGDALLMAGKYKEAEMVYVEDLKELKRNGWALHGLHIALQKQGRDKEAEAVYNQFKEVWKFADVELATSVVM